MWHAPTTTHADRRQIVRLLIDRVVLTVASENDDVKARVEWAGGAVRERTLPREVFEGYAEEWPPDTGYEQRRPALQLHKLLNNLRHFGPRIVPAIEAALDFYGW